MKTLLKAVIIAVLSIPLVVAPAMALERINDSEYVLGKTRGHVQKLCREADGTWMEGSCLFPELGSGVMLEYRKGRVSSHSLMMQGLKYGYTMLESIRSRVGEPDMEASNKDCDLYGWDDVQGLDFVVMICAAHDNSGVMAKKAGQ